MIIGAWRSLVAHLHGVQGVGGSNPLAPILHCRLMLNYFTPSWLLFPMLLLSILAHFHSNRPFRPFSKRFVRNGAQPGIHSRREAQQLQNPLLQGTQSRQMAIHAVDFLHHR